MTTLDDFLPLVRGRLPGCPDMILKDAVRDACIRFCRETRLLVETVTVATTAGERYANLFPPGGQAWEVLKVYANDGRTLMPSNRADEDGREDDLATGTPARYYLEGDGRLGLSPLPDADETLQAVLSLSPESDATEVDDALWSDWREAICAGARAWVRRHYGEWINPQAEADDRALFETAVDKARLRRARGATRMVLRVRAHAY